MTLPKKSIPDVTIHVEDFAAYLELEPAWGIFHCALTDGNSDSDYYARSDDKPFSEFEEHLIGVIDLLSPSQRKKLANLAWKFNKAKESK